jgi:hypothetical protein
MAFDRKDLAEPLLKLVAHLVEHKTLSGEEVEKGFDQHLELLEDVSIDIPASPRIVAHFVAASLAAGYLSWAYVRNAAKRFMLETGYAPRFLSLLLQCLRERVGVAEARRSWGQSGGQLEAFGVESPGRFVEENSLADLFPIPQCEREVLEMLRAGCSDEDVIKAVPALAGGEVDHEVRRCLLRCVLTHLCEELGGPERLAGRPDEAPTKARGIEDARERELVQRRAGLLKQWLAKRSEQAVALFELQKFAQQHGNPQGPARTHAHARTHARTHAHKSIPYIRLGGFGGEGIAHPINGVAGNGAASGLGGAVWAGMCGWLSVWGGGVGFLPRMLCTLYLLDIVEADAIRDWKDPPDNRDHFIAEVRA